MRRIALLLVAAAAVADAPKLPAPNDMIAANPTDAKFNPAKVEGMPPGPMGAPIAVDPNTKASIAYAKIPGGYTLPMHWHSHEEASVFISGAGTLTMDGKPYDLVPGSLVVIPPKTHHMLKCAAGSDCLILTRRAGPTDYNWVK
ncbi:MAG TPA: cupin domain-containing protein [Myxococcales bacterium]|nr:cupin domain-containing protein [Myxococcales bacterium]